jgi:hypothetical protein
MSDLPSLALVALSAFFLARNIAARRFFPPVLAGALFGAAIMVRYSNLVGVFPLAALLWLDFRARSSPKIVFRNALGFLGAASLFGILPLALYTGRLFGTPFRLVYEPFNQSRMAWSNLGPGALFYLKSTAATFGSLGIVLIALGLVFCAARPKYRLAGLVSILAYASFFSFYAFHSIREERYLLPAYPFLAVLFGLGILAIVEKFPKSALLGFLIVALCASYPLVYSQGKYRSGPLHEEATSLRLREKVAPGAVVFCDELSGPVRLYAGLRGYRFTWTDERTLRETLSILRDNGIPTYFFLDSSEAGRAFEAFEADELIAPGSAEIVSVIHGIPLYRIK